jgi:phage minor structural protein
MYRVNTIYILNRRKKIIDVIPSQGDSCFFDDEYELDLETFIDTYTLSVKDVKRYSDKLIGLNYIIFRFKGKDRLFQIFESGTTHEKKNIITDIYCENTGITLINEPTQPQVIVGNVKQFLDSVLINTEFEVEYVDSELLNTVLTIEIETKTNVLKAIQDNIASFSAELEFAVKRQGSKLKQIINVYKKKGKITNKIFTYSDNVNKIGQSKKWSDFCTALIPYGKDDITIHSVEWIKGKGDLADKPLNQDFIADEEAFKLYNNNGRHIFGYFESDANNASDLLKEAYEELQKRSKPQATYEMAVSYDDELDIGDTVSIRDFDFGVKPLLLEARVNKLKLSFSDETKCTAEFSNYKEVTSKIKNLSNKDDLLKEIIEFLGGIGIGDLTDEDIAKIREYLEKMGVEKEEIDKIFDEIQDIINPKPKPPDEGDDGDPIYVADYKNGVWLGDDRFYQIKKSNTVSTTDPANDEYADALALYEKYDISKYQNKANLNNLSSTGNKYKLYLIVEYYARKFGLDPNLVYAVIMGESRGDPYSTTGSNGGYGLMQCERSTYFKEWGNKAQTIKYIDGTTKTFLPSYSNMTPYKGGNATLSGITVDRNILNQIRFGCWELRQCIDYAHGNIFAGLVANNMGQGSLNWIVSKYVCDKYGYTFVDSYYLSSQSNQTKLKVYEELDSLKFDFAAYRQTLKDQKGLGTPNNVELYLCWYKVVDGQLPYYKDAQGNKLGYGVGVSTPKGTGKASSSDTRQIIVDTAKAIVQQHTDKLATYDQSYRTWNFKKPNKRSGTFYGIKNPICYDCSSMVTCCYGEAGLKSIFHSDSYCAYGTLVKYATAKDGYKMFKITKTSIENMKAGDIIMMCNNECPTTLTRAKAMAKNFTHHTLIYCGKENGTHMVAHARKWDYWPKAIRYMPVYNDIYKYGFCLRPYDLVEADNNNVEDTPIIDKTDMNEVYIKAVRKANAYDFYDDNNNLSNKVEGLFEDDDKVYPSSAPYTLIHFGLNDLTEKGITGIKTLTNILKTKYRNTPIFILKELHVGTAYADYTTVNTSIDAFNTEIKTFCDNEENVFLLDVSSKLETYTSVLNSNYTNDGYSFKDDTSIGVFYDAIKEKLLATPIGYKKKDDSGSTGGGNDDDSNASKREGKVIDIVLESTKTYTWPKMTIKSLTFKLQSDVDKSFYARMIFTTADEISYSQSKICYLEGVDCIAGQLVPKPNTGYKITIMANVNSSIDYKYYGSVSVDKGEGYADPYTFKGGEKVAEIAKTYLNQTGLEYRGQYSTTAVKTPASYSNPAKYLDKWYDSSRKKAQIDCSTLTKFAYMGLDYDHSPYANHKMTSLKRNTAYSWAFTFPRTAAEQAEYCVKNGWVLHDVDIINFSNLEPGDIVFWDRDNKENGRYMNCSHAAIVIKKTEDGGSVYTIESTQCENGVKTRLITENKTDKILFCARPKKL